MPKRSQVKSLAEESAAPGGTAAVDRALTLLAAFRPGEEALGLQELAGRTRQHKSTVLRLLASLIHAELVSRLPDGRYRLGPGIARLHAVYASSFSMDQAVMPVLRQLVERTGESAAFHVRQGGARLCLYRVDSSQPVRDHIRVRGLLPLDRGGGGPALLAYAGRPGPPYDRVRRDGVLVLAGDRVPELAGISAPCFDARGELVGAVTLTMPTERLDEAYRIDVTAAARAVSRALGAFPDVAPAMPPSPAGAGRGQAQRGAVTPAAGSTRPSAPRPTPRPPAAGSAARSGTAPRPSRPASAR